MQVHHHGPEVALLRPKLARLKLSGMLDTLNETATGARRAVASYSASFSTSCSPTRRVVGATSNELGRRLTKSGLAPVQDPGDLRFLLQSARSTRPRLVANWRPAASCSGPMNVFFVGQLTGSSKSHKHACRRWDTSPVARDTMSPTSAPVVLLDCDPRRPRRWQLRPRRLAPRSAP